MNHADKRMNPIHFGSDLADIRIWIQINPEIWIWITYQFLALAEFVLAECSCFYLLSVIPVHSPMSDKAAVCCVT